MSKIKGLLGLAFILQLLSFEVSAYCESYSYKRHFIREISEGLFEVQDFYLTGEKRSDTFLLTDKEEAKKTEYREIFCNGIRISKSSIIEGKYTTYHKNGNKDIEGVYKEGIRIGVWRSWYLSGKLHAESTYKENNQFTGYEVVFNENGSKHSEGEIRYSSNFMSSNVPINYWKTFIWDKNDQLQKEIIKEYDNNGNYMGLLSTYCRGLLVSVENFDGDNREVVFDLPSELSKTLDCQ